MRQVVLAFLLYGNETGYFPPHLEWRYGVYGQESPTFAEWWSSTGHDQYPWLPEDAQTPNDIPPPWNTMLPSFYESAVGDSIVRSRYSLVKSPWLPDPGVLTCPEFVDYVEANPDSGLETRYCQNQDFTAGSWGYKGCTAKRMQEPGAGQRTVLLMKAGCRTKYGTFIMLMEPAREGGSNEWTGHFDPMAVPNGGEKPSMDPMIKIMHMRSGNTGHANFGYSDGSVRQYWTDDPGHEESGHDPTKEPSKPEWNGTFIE
jgi:hypothetical protein